MPAGGGPENSPSGGTYLEPVGVQSMGFTPSRLFPAIPSPIPIVTSALFGLLLIYLLRTTYSDNEMTLALIRRHRRCPESGTASGVVAHRSQLASHQKSQTGPRDRPS
jgi:hypothetical protein